MRHFTGEREWVAGLGSLREVVRQRVVAAQLRTCLPGAGPPGSVLDVGCGQGTQALELARAGWDVTGLDLSPALLGMFEARLRHEPEDVRSRVTLVDGAGEDASRLTPGPFDVVLCHGVLMYLDDERPLLAALSAVAARNAILSVVVRNGAAPAMRDGLRGEWEAASAAFDSREHTAPSGVRAHGHTREEMDALVGGNGWRLLEWYGVRVFTDHRQQPPPDQRELEALLAAELRAGARDPYRQVAGLFHLLYER